MGRLIEAWAEDRQGFGEPDNFELFIAKKNVEKAAKRRNRSIKLMKAYKGLYDCKECIHGLIKSCLDRLPNGCEYFSNEVTGRRFNPGSGRWR